jgi:hypothetical protein
MDPAHRLFALHQRTMFVSPLENRTLQVADVAEAGGLQPLRHVG